jgi:hypothetical protein
MPKPSLILLIAQAKQPTLRFISGHNVVGLTGKFGTQPYLFNQFGED